MGNWNIRAEIPCRIESWHVVDDMYRHCVQVFDGESITYYTDGKLELCRKNSEHPASHLVKLTWQYEIDFDRALNKLRKAIRKYWKWVR